MFNFGKRKIKSVNYTRYLALPKDWLRFHGIDAGDEVLVELTERGDLVIKPVKEERKK